MCVEVNNAVDVVRRVVNSLCLVMSIRRSPDRDSASFSTPCQH